MQKLKIPSDLIRVVREHRIVPFVGTGVSVGVKPGLFPSWKGLLEQLVVELDENDRAADAKLVRQLVDTENYLQAAECAYEKLGAYLFNRRLRRTFHVRCPEGADLRVAHAIWRLAPPVVITTNYDEVLRWAGPSHLEVISNDQEEEFTMLGEATSQQPWLWHLHGPGTART
jgi:hypothetical protein